MAKTTKKSLWMAIPFALAVVLVGAAAGGARAAEKKTYLLIAPHTPQDCLAALDSFELRKKLQTFEFGCMQGDHTPGTRGSRRRPRPTPWRASRTASGPGRARCSS